MHLLTCCNFTVSISSCVFLIVLILINIGISIYILYNNRKRMRSDEIRKIIREIESES